MPRSNSIRRLSVALGLSKNPEKGTEKLDDVKEEKKAEEPTAEPTAVVEPAAAAEAPKTDPVVEAQVKNAATAPIPGTGALVQFLTLSKQKFLNDIKANPPKSAQWTVAMGNEAGDLDSLASAIAFAFYNATKSKGSPTIPLYQVAATDFKLRPENIYALSLAGITAEAAPETLYTLSDIHNYPSPLTFPVNTFALVDHNRLGGAFSTHPDDANVVAVIDHHEDEHLYENANPRTIFPCGSCASHVAKLFFPPGVELPTELATLLLTAILIDTDGLKVGGKGTKEDVEAVLFLISRSTLSFSPEGNQFLEKGDEILAKSTAPGSASAAAATSEADKEKKDKDGDEWVKVQEALSEVPSIKDLAEKLADKKANVSDLSIRDLLRRDYKEYDYSTPYVVQPDKKGKKKEKVEKKVEEKVEKKEGEAEKKEGEGEAAPAESSSAPAPAAPAAPATTGDVKAGLASVPVSLEDMDAKGHFEEEIVKWMQERKISILGILSSFHNPKKNWDAKEKKKGKGRHRREMLWMVLEPQPATPPAATPAAGGTEQGGELAPVAIDAAGLSTTPPPPEVPVDYKTLSKKFFKGLKKTKSIEPKKSKAVKIDKKKLPKDLYVKAKVYEQGNVKANRKVTAPVLKALVEDTKVETPKNGSSD